MRVPSAEEAVTTEFIVQFKLPITSSDRSLLEKDFEVFGYLPDDALVVRGTYQKLSRFASEHSQINAFIPYLPL